jgi:hypothetical protein
MHTDENVGNVPSWASTCTVDLVHGRNPRFVIETIPLRPGQRFLGGVLTNNCAEAKEHISHIRKTMAQRRQG